MGRSARSILVLLLSAAVIASAEHFIRVENGQFVKGCEKFFISGWNQWEVCEASAGAPELIAATIAPGKTGPQMVREMLDMGQDAGFHAMRAWAHTVSPDFALQSSPGVYNEGMFRGLDYFLDEARKHDIRVILSFTDNWPKAGGADEYVKWSPSAGSHPDFFTDEGAKNLYKEHVRTVINRVNSINGRVYRDDPTIMAWNLINEPRCTGCPDAVQAWIDEMAPFVKSLDSNHLLSVGEEGFYSTSGKNYANPQGANRWPEWEGQDFLNNHRSPAIDFLSFHSWIDNWEDVTESFQRSWIREHVADGKELGKPVILQEFGKIVQPGGPSMDERNRFFDIVYDEVQTLMKEGTLMGAMFWQWYDNGQEAPEEEGGGAGKYGIYRDDATFGKIRTFTDFVNGLSGPAAGCTDPGPSVGGPPSCEDSRVNGRPGTGLEGPGCDIDINECVRATAGCPKNGGCINTDGGFECQCYPTFELNGDICVPTADLLRLDSQYVSKGAGEVACDEGDNIQFPVGAPGFVYDPTGSVDRNKFTKGRLGSRDDVSTRDCQLACEMAEGCDSFSYNPTLKQCFLKSCPSKETCYKDELICTAKTTGKSFSCGIWETYYSQTRSCGSVSSSENGGSEDEVAVEEENEVSENVVLEENGSSEEVLVEEENGVAEEVVFEENGIAEETVVEEENGVAEEVFSENGASEGSGVAADDVVTESINSGSGFEG
ncbi:hypothetical protein BSKO_07978 [Bryopsis sp. KO-2023]|nr:hypothetical protein BSKO_07978 [Bryopsis sp. KO-2023]